MRWQTAWNRYQKKLAVAGREGFSLVELIIVMAIMAILVGVVASQVLPYMDKARKSRDQQIYHALLTDLTSSISQCDHILSDQKDMDITDLTDELGDAGWKQVAEIFSEYRGGFVTDDYLKEKLRSKEAEAKNYQVEFSYTQSTGIIKVYLHGHGEDDGESKYYAVSRE